MYNRILSFSQLHLCAPFRNNAATNNKIDEENVRKRQLE